MRNPNPPPLPSRVFPLLYPAVLDVATRGRRRAALGGKLERRTGGRDGGWQAEVGRDGARMATASGCTSALVGDAGAGC